jgi:sugar transferase (PEP-CTERM/EpsH1 system associated)
MRKKILVISPYFPCPPHDGGKVRIYNLLKHLSRDNDLYLLSYIDSYRARAYITDMERFCKKVYVVLRDENKRITGDNLARSVSFFYTPEMIRELENVVREVKPDIVQIDFLIMSQYVNHVGDIPVVYTEHDISNINFEQSFHDRDLPEKMRFIEWNKLLKYERDILPRFRAVIVLTERDRDILREFAPGVTSVLAPTGVDLEYFVPAEAGATPDELNLLFVGHYKHYPNLDAVQYFVKEIFPQIVREIPGATFNIVGSGVTRELLELGGGQVRVVGEVDDVRPFYQKAAVFVAPVRLGGGIKGKILEAMASGIPVVATEEAGKGIRGSDGVHLRVARNENDFAAKVIELLKDRALRTALGGRGRKLVEEQYDWKKIAAGLDVFFETLLPGEQLRKAKEIPLRGDAG